MDMEIAGRERRVSTFGALPQFVHQFTGQWPKRTRNLKRLIPICQASLLMITLGRVSEGDHSEGYARR